MIPTGYQAACIANLCHSGATECAYIAFSNVSAASEDADNPSMSHRGFSLSAGPLQLTQHIFSPWGGIHSPFAFYTSLPVCPCLALPLCQTLCSSQVPRRPRQWAGMPIASSQPPLRGADATALLPGDSLTRINTFTHAPILFIAPARYPSNEDCERSTFVYPSWVDDHGRCCSLTFICCCSDPQKTSAAQLTGRSNRSIMHSLRRSLKFSLLGKRPPFCLSETSLDFIITSDFGCLCWECSGSVFTNYALRSVVS